jgi:hypothetical protein
MNQQTLENNLTYAGVNNPKAIAAHVFATLNAGGDQAAIVANLTQAGLAAPEAARISAAVWQDWQNRPQPANGSATQATPNSVNLNLPINTSGLSLGIVGTGGQQPANNNGGSGNAQQPQTGTTQVVTTSQPSKGFPAWATVMISVACALGIVALIMFAFGYFANANGIESNKAKVAQVETEVKKEIADAKVALEAKVVAADLDRLTMKHEAALRELKVDYVLGSHKAAIEDNKADIDALGAVAAAHDDTIDQLRFDGRMRDLKIGGLEKRADATDLSIARARSSAGGWRNRVQALEGRADATEERLNSPLTISHGGKR